MWGLQTGAVWNAAAGVGSALAGRVAESALGGKGVPEDKGLACADFDTHSVKQLKQFDLAGLESPHTCLYRATVAGNVQTVLSLRESDAYYPMTTQRAKSRKAKAPVITVSSGLAGKVDASLRGQGSDAEAGQDRSARHPRPRGVPGARGARPDRKAGQAACDPDRDERPATAARPGATAAE